MGERAKDFPDPVGGTPLNHLNGHGEAETREFSEIQFGSPIRWAALLSTT